MFVNAICFWTENTTDSQKKHGVVAALGTEQNIVQLKVNLPSYDTGIENECVIYWRC
jgi:hypothetical protein